MQAIAPILDFSPYLLLIAMECLVLQILLQQRKPWHRLQISGDSHSTIRAAEVALLASILPKIRRAAAFEADLQTFYG